MYAKELSPIECAKYPRVIVHAHRGNLKEM